MTYMYRRFIRTRYGRHTGCYLVLVIIGLIFTIPDFFINIKHQDYVSCNSYRECEFYTINKKTGAKTNIKQFRGEDLKYECELNSAGQYAVSSGNFNTRRGRDIYWILNLYLGEKYKITKSGYGRKSKCIKDGTKYVKLARKRNITFKL